MDTGQEGALAGKKQAIIIDASGDLPQMLGTRLCGAAISVILAGIGFLPFRYFLNTANPMLERMLSGTVAALWVGLMEGMALLIFLKDVPMPFINPRPWLNAFNMKLASSRLRKQGYDVKVLRGDEVYGCVVERMLGDAAKNADGKSTTLVFFDAHGCVDERGRSVLAPQEDSRPRGWIAHDLRLAGKVSEIPGDKIILVNSCNAGGFADAASGLPVDKREKIAFVTASGSGTASAKLLLSDFARYARRGGRVSDFFREHEGRHAGRIIGATADGKTILRHEPRAFIGSRAIRI